MVCKRAYVSGPAGEAKINRAKADFGDGNAALQAQSYLDAVAAYVRVVRDAAPLVRRGGG